MRYLTTVLCILFLSVSDRLFAQDAENVEHVGRIYNQWLNTYNIVIEDNLAFVAAGRTGLQIVDVSDPENPESLSYWDDNPGEARDVVVSD